MKKFIVFTGLFFLSETLFAQGRSKFPKGGNKESVNLIFRTLVVKIPTIGYMCITRSFEPIGFARLAPQKDLRNTVFRVQPYHCGTP